MDEIAQSVLEIVRGQCEWGSGEAVDGLDAELSGAGFGSLEIVRLMLAVEARFRIRFPAEMVELSVFRTPRTVAEAVRALQEACGAHSPHSS